MNVNDLKGQTIALLASGGLDTCTITHWLKENGVKVVALTADLAQPDETDFADIEKRMRACGADDFVALPLQNEIAALGLEGIQLQACYEGRYWNVTGFGRQAITVGALPAMKKKGIKILAHGATGRGNDQVRFQLIANMHDPSVAVYAPWRDNAFLTRFPGRAEMIDYCAQHGLPIKASRDKPYSTDANLLGLTHEGGKLESIENPASTVVPEMGVWAWDAPNTPETFTVRFEKGAPVAINGHAVTTFQAFSEANALAGKHGVGIGLHLVENRFVGVKSRGVYEQPGIELLGTCYNFLLQMILDRRAKEMFDSLGSLFAKQVYQGYYNDLASSMIKAAVAPVTQRATGEISVSLYKGNVSFLCAKNAPHSLFTADGSMENEGTFDHADSEGFLKVLSVHAKALARTRSV